MKHYDYEISLFVEGELPENKKEELFSHLSTCDKCSRMLHDYENIKDSIAQFYKALPDPVNGVKYNTTRSRKFSLNPVRRRYVIPISVAALVIFLLFFLVKINLWQSKVNITPVVKKESASSNFHNIAVFNRVINKAIEYRKQKTILGEFRLDVSGNKQLEFNEVINSALYNKYKD